MDIKSHRYSILKLQGGLSASRILHPQIHPMEGRVVFVEKNLNMNGLLQFKPVLFKGQLKLNSHNPEVSLLFCLIMNKLRFENTLPA